MSTFSIGVKCEDSEFKIFATLNGHEGTFKGNSIDNVILRRIAESLAWALEGASGEEIVILEREDASDFVDLGEED